MPEPALAGFSNRGFSQAEGPQWLKPQLEKDLERPFRRGGVAADPGVNTGAIALRARPLKRPPTQGNKATIVSVQSMGTKISNIFG